MERSAPLFRRPWEPRRRWRRAMSSRRLFGRLIERCARTNRRLDARTAEALPGYAAWLRHGAGRSAAWPRRLVELGHQPRFSRAIPFRWLADDRPSSAERPAGNAWDRGIDRAEGLLDEVEAALVRERPARRAVGHPGGDRRAGGLCPTRGWPGGTGADSRLLDPAMAALPVTSRTTPRQIARTRGRSLDSGPRQKPAAGGSGWPRRGRGGGACAGARRRWKVRCSAGSTRRGIG